MKPISEEDRLEYVDPATGIKYRFRVLTGKNEVELWKIQDGKKKVDRTQEDVFESVNQLFDFLLIGWEGDGLPAFPEKPSSFFKMKQKSELCDIAFKLNEMEMVDVKN